MIKNRNEWQKAFERQMDIAERKSIAEVKRFYKSEYNKGIQSFLSMNATNYENTFVIDDLTKLYRNLYVKIGLHFAKWYARTFDKYITKGVNPKQFESFWAERFAFLGMSIGAKRVTLVSGTAKKTLRKILTGFMSDENFMAMGVDQQARVLRNTFNTYSANQATRLVRTEATAAANFATMQSAQTIFPGSQMKKEWIASFDDRTRDAHAEADGSIVNHGDAFLVGGDFMQYPGDPAGSAANVINCRCSVAPFPVEDAQSIADIEDIGFGLANQPTF
tara:strand:- start:257 stop:1087 length:831 start_codon:yes stop_codon:yes gene_type:complete